MARFELKLLTYLDLQKPVEFLEQDIKAVEEKAHGTVGEVCYIRTESLERKIKKQVEDALRQFADYCRNKNIGIYEIGSSISNAKKIEDLMEPLTKSLNEHLDRIGEVYINSGNRNSRLFEFWDYCRATDFFCGRARFVDDTVSYYDVNSGFDIYLSLMVMKFVKQCNLKKDVLELVRTAVENGGERVCFVCENRRRLAVMRQSIPELQSYYLSGVFSLKGFEYMDDFSYDGEASLYVLTKSQPESVKFMLLPEENVLLRRYCFRLLYKWLNQTGPYPSILMKYTNELPYSQLDMDYLDIMYNCKKACGFRKSLGRSKSKVLSDYALCIGGREAHPEYYSIENTCRVIRSKNVLNGFDISRVMVSDDVGAVREVFPGDIIVKMAAAKERKFYLIPRELEYRYFVSDEFFIIRLQSDLFSPEYLCLYLNAQVDSRKLVAEYFSYLVGKLLQKDLEGLPIMMTKDARSSTTDEGKAYYMELYHKYCEGETDSDYGDEMEDVSERGFENVAFGKEVFSKKRKKQFSDDRKSNIHTMENAAKEGLFKTAVSELGVIVERIMRIWCSEIDGFDYFEYIYNHKDNAKLKAVEARNILESHELLPKDLLERLDYIRNVRNARFHGDIIKESVTERKFEESKEAWQELEKSYDRWREIHTDSEVVNAEK